MKNKLKELREKLKAQHSYKYGAIGTRIPILEELIDILCDEGVDIENIECSHKWLPNGITSSGTITYAIACCVCEKCGEMKFESRSY